MGDDRFCRCGVVSSQPNTPAACGNCYANANRYAFGLAAAHEHGNCSADDDSTYIHASACGDGFAHRFAHAHQGAHGDAAPGPHRHANGYSCSGSERPRPWFCHL